MSKFSRMAERLFIIANQDYRSKEERIQEIIGWLASLCLKFALDQD